MDWSVDDVMPGRDGPENLRILKKSQLRLTLGYGGRRLSFCHIWDVTKVIDMLTQEDFDGAFQKLLERYNKCIAAGGDYFEGD